MTGRIIRSHWPDIPLPKWVNYEPAQSGIRYNLENLKPARRNDRRNFNGKKRKAER